MHLACCVQFTSCVQSMYSLLAVPHSQQLNSVSCLVVCCWRCVSAYAALSVWCVFQVVQWSAVGMYVTETLQHVLVCLCSDQGEHSRPGLLSYHVFYIHSWYRHQVLRFAAARSALVQRPGSVSTCQGVPGIMLPPRHCSVHCWLRTRCQTYRQHSTASAVYLLFE
jgi:hypothetical protein